MKTIQGHARIALTAPAEACFELLAGVERYPAWTDGLVRHVEVLERRGDGGPAMIRMSVHVAQSPFGKDFQVTAAVTTQAGRAVALRGRSGDGSGLELAWTIRSEGGTTIELSFRAVTSRVPGFVPVFGIGNEIAEFLIQTARRALTPAET